MALNTTLEINGKIVDNSRYLEYHRSRIQKTMALVRKWGGKKLIELGAHPWAMTQKIIEDPVLDIVATVSAEEVTSWPDDIGLIVNQYHIKTPSGAETTFDNYSANIERRLFDIPGNADCVVAAEIIEHLVRAPHVMLLNINSWLRVGGILIITTPNGCQFSNPLRTKPRMPAYRAHMYERHSYMYAMDGLQDLVQSCGFELLESGYSSWYGRTGISRIYDWLGKIPSRYMKEKFTRTIFVVARKARDLTALEETPKIYGPSDDWEHINS